MATGQVPISGSARRAEMLREAWRPVGQRLTGGYHSFQDFVLTHPLLAQGGYYLLTGLWPWVSMTTFLWVTGQKTDLWLVQTVGALIVVVGAVLCVASVRREHTASIATLAIGSAAALAFVDVLFVAQGRIPAVYLLDAVIEVGLVGLWVYCLRSGRLHLAPNLSNLPVARPAEVVPASLAATPMDAPAQTN